MKRWDDYLGPEQRLQRAVGNYLDAKGALWTHPLNEAKRSKFERWLMKILGCKKGVPDVLIFEPQEFTSEEQFLQQFGQPKIGLAIELKIGSNKPTVEQSFWLNSLRAKGWETAVCRTLDEAIETIDNYLGR